MWAEDPDTEENVLVGITSANDDYWQPHQYGEIVELTADAIEHFQTDDDYQDFDVDGVIETTDNYHKFLNDVNFDGVEINPGEDDDPIMLGLRETSGNSGFHSTQYDIGAERLVCSNGLKRFMAENSYDQTHQEELDSALPQIAVQSVLEGTDAVESKLEEAQQHSFRNKEEAIEVLYDLDIPQQLGLEYSDTVLTFEDEVEDRNNASQYEVYQAATNLISNWAPDDMSEHQRDRLHGSAAELLETGDGQLPDIDDMAETTLENRAYALTEADADEYWDGETKDLRTALQERGLTA